MTFYHYASGYKSKDAAEDALDTACCAGQVSEWEFWKARITSYKGRTGRRWKIELPE